MAKFLVVANGLDPYELSAEDAPAAWDAIALAGLATCSVRLVHTDAIAAAAARRAA